MKKNENNPKAVKKNNRKSLKGSWGKIGAPPKPVNWPSDAFTMATLFSRNTKQCELSLRTKVADGVAGGSILPLMTKKQPGGAVGRPKSVFVLKKHFVSSKHELSPKTISRLNRTVSVTPAIVAVPASPATVIVEVPASPVPAIG
jgi:hypothetical protein